MTIWENVIEFSDQLHYRNGEKEPFKKTNNLYLKLRVAKKFSMAMLIHPYMSQIFGTTLYSMSQIIFIKKALFVYLRRCL